MFCGNCGNELREGTRFCPKCGAITRLGRQQNQPPAEPEQTIPPVIPEPEPVLGTESVQEPTDINVPVAEPSVKEDTAPAPRQQVRQRPAVGKAKPAVRLKAMPVKPAQEEQPAQQAEPAKPVSPPPAPERKAIKRAPIVAVSVVAIVLVLIIAVTVGSQRDSAALPTATPFSDAPSDSSKPSAPSVLPTGTSFAPPNGLPEGEIWNHVVRTESYGLITFEPYYVIPAYRCTQEILDDTLAEISKNYTPDEPYEALFYRGNQRYNVLDSVDVFSDEGIAALWAYTVAMHDLWEVDVCIVTLESASVYSDFSSSIQVDLDGKTYPLSTTSGNVLFILGKSDNTYVAKKNIPSARSFVVDGERMSEIPFLTDDFFQIIQDAVSQPSFTAENFEKTMIELCQNLIQWLMANRPMKNPGPLNSIPTGQWIYTDTYYGSYYEPSINPDSQIYINSVDESSITFTPTVTIHSELSAHNGETYTLETPIKAAMSRDDVHGDLWGTFTYTDPWGNAFEGSLSQVGGDGALMIKSEMVAYGPEHQFTYGISGNFLPVDSIID